MHPESEIKPSFVENTSLQFTNQGNTRGVMFSSDPAQADENETLSDDTVLIIGGGPVGLLLATVLAFYGVKSLLLERNKSTTK